MGQNSCSPARNCSFHKWRRANTEWEFRFMWILLVCLPCIFAEDTPHPKYFFPGIKKWRQRQHAVLLRIGWRADPTGFAPFPLSLSFTSVSGFGQGWLQTCSVCQGADSYIHRTQWNIFEYSVLKFGQCLQVVYFPLLFIHCFSWFDSIPDPRLIWLYHRVFYQTQEWPLPVQLCDSRAQTGIKSP